MSLGKLGQVVIKNRLLRLFHYAFCGFSLLLRNLAENSNLQTENRPSQPEFLHQMETWEN